MLQAGVESIGQDIFRVTLEGAVPFEPAILEDQPAQVPPGETHERAMWIGSRVGVLMMHAMDGHPAGGRVLQRTDTEERKAVLQPFRTSKAAVGEQAMVSDVDPERAE